MVFIGAVVFSIIGFFVCEKAWKGQIANKFIPKPEQEEADFLKPRRELRGRDR